VAEDEIASGTQPSAVRASRGLVVAVVVLLAAAGLRALSSEEGMADALRLTGSAPATTAGSHLRVPPGGLETVRLPRAAMVLVGHGIEPGVYVSRHNFACSWARLSGTGGHPFEIILAEKFSGTRSIVIEASDVAFFHAGCRRLERVRDRPTGSAPPGPWYPP
jgi:hypothetical protein